MTNTLYRKYRPQTFSELIGQNHIKITLTSELLSDRVAHAYIFFGPRGIGKTTTARLLAKALNCEQREKNQAEPCNQCSSCQEIICGQSLDLVEIDAASHTGVDNVRENIIANSRITPVKRKYKVFIIDEVHMLSVSAFNALLKTLEEPPERVVFILATTEIQRVPQTIVSRCQRFDFKKVSLQEIIVRLKDFCHKEKVKVAESVLKRIAQNSEGSMRDAESLLGQIIALGEKDITEDIASLVIPSTDNKVVLSLIKHLINKSSREAIELVDRLTAEGIRLDGFIKAMIEFLRQMLLAKIKEQSNLLEQLIDNNPDQKKELGNLLTLVEIPQLMRWIKIFLTTQSNLKGELTIPELPLELAVLEICENVEKEDKTALSAKSEGVVSAAVTLGAVEPAKKNYEKIGVIKKVFCQAFHKKEDATSSKLISSEEIFAKWPQVLEELKKYNHSLTLTLSVAEIMSIESNVLTLGFAYKFYQDRVWETKNKQTVEKVLQDVYNNKILLKCVTCEDLKEKLAEKANAASKSSEDVVNAALDAFGGEVVENN